MLVDSHCHLNFPELHSSLAEYLQKMNDNQVNYALCVGTRPDNLDCVVQLANEFSGLFASVGIHPDERLVDFVLTEEYLSKYLLNPKVVAVGETGLDYYRVEDQDMSWQHERFLLHINVAKSAQLPLIVHTRNSIEDTIAMLKSYADMNSGAVMHCFTENLEYAKQCLDLGCYISISGIVTFKNAPIVKEVARYIPLDRLLIETDAPFLAPVPYRGQTNHPALVLHTAQYIAQLKSVDFAAVAEATSANFFTLFKRAKAFKE